MTRSRHRIVFLNRSYWPDIEATGQLLTDLCRGLAPEFDVHVVCGQPNSPEPNSSFLQVGTERLDGVTIHRLPHRQFDKKNPFGRILNLLSFFHSARRFLRTTELSADVVVSETDPFLLPLAGAEFARRVQAKHCVYLQDIYPDVAEAVGKVRLPLIARLIRGRLRAAYKDATRVIVLGRCMKKRLINQPWGIDSDKIAIVPNWSDCETIAPIAHSENTFRKKLQLDDSFVVMHSGNMGLTQRLEDLLSAAADPKWPARAKLILVGNGASRGRLLKHAESLRLPFGRVEFIYYQPRNQLAESLSAADVHVVSMHQNITGCLCPSKLYGIMAAGRSMVAIAASHTDLAQTIRERNIGWCVPPGSPTAIAEAIANAEAESRLHVDGKMASEFALKQLRSRRAAVEDFDRPVIIQRFTSILSELFPVDGTATQESAINVAPSVQQIDGPTSDVVLTH